MDIIFLILLFILTIIFIIVGFFRQQNVILVFGGIGLMLIGSLTYFGGGISYVSGTSSVQSAISYFNTTTNVTSSSYLETIDDVTSKWDTSLNPYLFFFFELTGLVLILLSAVDVWFSKKQYRRGKSRDEEE